MPTPKSFMHNKMAIKSYKILIIISVKGAWAGKTRGAIGFA